MRGHGLKAVSNITSDALDVKAREGGKIIPNLRAELFFMANQPLRILQEIPRSAMPMKVPPRVVSDPMVTIFFRDWAPLFPILHQPTFLKVYAEYFVRPERVEAQQSIAQIYLVFAIAAVSAEVGLWRCA